MTGAACGGALVSVSRRFPPPMRAAIAQEIAAACRPLPAARLAEVLTGARPDVAMPDVAAGLADVAVLVTAGRAVRRVDQRDDYARVVLIAGTAESVVGGGPLPLGHLQRRRYGLPPGRPVHHLIRIVVARDLPVLDAYPLTMRPGDRRGTTVVFADWRAHLRHVVAHEVGHVVVSYRPGWDAAEAEADRYAAAVLAGGAEAGDATTPGVPRSAWRDLRL